LIQSENGKIAVNGNALIFAIFTVMILLNERIPVPELQKHSGGLKWLTKHRDSKIEKSIIFENSQIHASTEQKFNHAGRLDLRCCWQFLSVESVFNIQKFQLPIT
jgi:hypothetical protein